jgi:serine/threonine-protein kinase
MIGKLIHGRYRIVEEIGQDSTSTIYLAEEAPGKDKITLQILRPEWVLEQQSLDRFRQVCDAMQNLDCPAAIKVLDCGEDEGTAFIVSEYVSGRTLAAVLTQEGPLPARRALELVQQVAICLHSAHAQGLVHGDVQPANILLADQGHVKLTGFGVAWGIELSKLQAMGQTGTPHYLSPEQSRGQTGDARSDVYGLGVTLFEMLTGKRPYDADNPAEVVVAHLLQSIPSLRQVDKDIPPQVDDLVSKCLAKEPGYRYQSAGELLNAIDETLDALAPSTKETEIDLTGETLGGYEILEEIGRGGMAFVYKARDPALDRDVAIKVLPQYFAHDRNFATRFEREAKAVARLQHPNILPVHSFGRERGLSYIVMQYVDMGTLQDRLGSPLDLETAVRIVAQIGQALDYAHRRGVIHRDVKPSNVLMHEEEWALLTDFGLARMLESTAQLTKSGEGLGTPAYMSPEQGQGAEIDRRSDVYSLGVVLYEMVTGKVPYEATTPMALMLKHITEDLPLPRTVNPELPREIERVIVKSLAKDPDDRYQTVGSMIDALQQALQDARDWPTDKTPAAMTSVLPKTATGAEAKARSFWQRMPVWAWGALVVALLAITVGGWAISQGGKAIPTATLPVPEATHTAVASLATATPVPATPTRARPTSTPTPTSTATQQALPTATHTSTPMPTATATATPTASPTLTATASPTAAPTATAAPSPTPTLEIGLRPAPRLIAPADGTSFSGWNAEVNLQWESVGALAEDEYYVVRIPYDSAGGVAEFWRRETTFRVPPNFSLVEVGFPDRHYNWTVQVMRCTGNCDRVEDDNTKKQGVAVGEKSAEGLFYWHPDVPSGDDGRATPTATPAPP